MKKILYLVFILMLSLFSLAGCKKKDSEKIKIVCTVYPSYNWVKEIIRGEEDKFEVIQLIDNGLDLHSYQASVKDIGEILTSDIFVYVGGESDEWVEDVIKDAKKEGFASINLMEVLKDNIKLEEDKEGMTETEHDHEGHDHEEHEEHDHEHEEEYDEHVWLSLRNAKIVVSKIEEEISKKDKSNKYKENKESYLEKIDNLDNEYKNAVKDFSAKTLVFGDRFPFRYLVDDYNLDYFAAFKGCSAESEASFETIIFLAKKLDELKLKAIFIIDNGSRDIASEVIQNTKDKNQVIYSLNSMQTTKSNANTSYLKIMEENLEVIKEAMK